jgi:hypothetical protein
MSSLLFNPSGPSLEVSAAFLREKNYLKLLALNSNNRDNALNMAPTQAN